MKALQVIKKEWSCYMVNTVFDWQIKLAQELIAVSESPVLDAQVVLAHALGRSRSWVLAHPEAKFSPVQLDFLTETRQALLLGKPLPYILGHWEFFGLDFLVTPDVLIPRPETELLVEQALQWLSMSSDPCRALEVGTGSGCIAISLAVHQPGLKMIASDVSPVAITVARQNAGRHAVAQRIEFVLTDLLSAINGRFELLCANLPYIPTAILSGLPVAKYEPNLALDGGQDGFTFIRRFLQQATTHLAENGLLLAEIETNQGEAAKTLAKSLYPAAQVGLLQDLSGRDRLLRIENRV